jgi:hypothetical protein
VTSPGSAGSGRRHRVPPASTLPLSFEFGKAAPVFVGPSALFASRMLLTVRQQIVGGVDSASAAVQIARSAAFEPWETRIPIKDVVMLGRVAGQAMEICERNLSFARFSPRDHEGVHSCKRDRKIGRLGRYMPTTEAKISIVDPAVTKSD